MRQDGGSTMQTQTSRDPELSVILVTPDSYETIRRTVKHLRSQNACDRMELVIVTPVPEALELVETDVSRFLTYQIVGIDRIHSIASANAAGVRRARAPVVALAEDHAFPAPGWAEALIAAHQHPRAVVGPAVRNANPDSVVSWADLLIAYAPWVHPAQAENRDHLPGHNSSYKREILLSYGSEMESKLDAESVLHWELRSQGHQLYLEPAAQVFHMNFGRLSSWLPAQYYSGRVFAASRAHGWGLPQRIAYALAGPLIPPIRFRRIFAQVRRSGCWEQLPGGVLPMLMVGLAVSAFGEIAGYLTGAGQSKPKLAAFEFHRVRHLGKRPQPSQAMSQM
ncbi:MAG TPA: glycosyltransferase [Nitrospiraceae bacterium]|nr:glycosyltransferase [Nitrospiraceae bacterium]